MAEVHKTKWHKVYKQPIGPPYMYLHTYNTCMYMYMYVNYQAMHTQAFTTQIDSC